MSPCCFPKMVVTEAQKRTRENIVQLITSLAKSGQPKNKEGEEIKKSLFGLVGDHLETGEEVVLRRSTSEMEEELKFWERIRQKAQAASLAL